MDALNLALISTPALTNCHLEQAFHQGCHHSISPCQKHDAPAHPHASSFQRFGITWSHLTTTSPASCL